MDMIVVARQLVEKTREHDDKLYIMFVDIQKTYDSVLSRGVRRGVSKVSGNPGLSKLPRQTNTVLF